MPRAPAPQALCKYLGLVAAEVQSVHDFTLATIWVKAQACAIQSMAGTSRNMMNIATTENTSAIVPTSLCRPPSPGDVRRPNYQPLFITTVAPNLFPAAPVALLPDLVLVVIDWACANLCLGAWKKRAGMVSPPMPPSCRGSELVGRQTALTPPSNLSRSHSRPCICSDKRSCAVSWRKPVV